MRYQLLFFILLQVLDHVGQGSYAYFLRHILLCQRPYTLTSDLFSTSKLFGSRWN